MLEKSISSATDFCNRLENDENLQGQRKIVTLLFSLFDSVDTKVCCISFQRCGVWFYEDVPGEMKIYT